MAFAIASAVEYLRALTANGVALDAARGMIYFRMSADADEFLTIAKFVAFGNCGRESRKPAGLHRSPLTSPPRPRGG
ncbi:MAG: methylmalonyl-CoA mutase family protein [Pseudolabrys sp.]